MMSVCLTSEPMNRCMFVRHLNQMKLTSCHETDNSSHIDVRSKKYQVSLNSRLDLHSLKALYSMATCSVYTTMVFTQPADLSEKACFYAGADWRLGVARGQ